MSNEQVKNEVAKKAKSEVAVLDIESFGDQGFENLTSIISTSNARRF